MLDTIKRRHSVRNYRNTPIKQEAIEKLLEAMRMAPSANNEQMWKFVIVTGEKRKEVAGACVQDFIGEAPVIVVALSEKSKDDYNMAFAIDHLMLEATDQGLGTCVVRSFNEEQVKSVLNVPANYHVFAVVPVGYSEHEVEATPRKSIQEIICWEKFQ